MIFAKKLMAMFLFLAVALGVAGCGRSELLFGVVPDADAAAADAAASDADAAVGEGGSDASVDAPTVLTSIQVSPPLGSIAVGTKIALTATGIYSDNTHADLTAMAVWTSNASSVATVAAGVVTAVSSGNATVTATFGGLTAISAITVPTATLSSIAVTPANPTIGIGGDVVFAATATLSDGSHQDVTSSAAWTSPNPQVATVSATGVAQGVSGGTSMIQATVGAVSGQTLLTVTSGTLVSIAVTPTNPSVGTGITFPFTATATFSDNSVADVTATATWASSNPTSLSLAANVGTSVAAGTSIVTASVGSITGTTTVTITTATLVTIAVTPATSTLAISGTEALIATGTFSDGSTLDLTASVTWSSSALSVASVSNASGSAGVVTALAAGSSRITAAFGSVTANATVTVTAASLVSIAIAPQNPSAPLATTVPFTAQGTYSDGSVVDVTSQVTWSSDNTAVATISNAAPSDGVATANAIGTAGIHATIGGVTASTNLTVTAAVLTGIVVTPANSSIGIGVSEPMVATGTYSDGTTLDLTTTAVWQTGSAAVASVSNAAGSQGLLTALTAGTTSVKATVGAVSGSTTATVTAPTLQQIVVTPIAPSLNAGLRLQFQATAIYANNTSQNVTAMATWASSAPGVATVNGSGRALAVAAGTTMISATFQGLTGSATLTVTAAAVVSITVTPINPTYTIGDAARFAATAIYSDNTSRDVTPQATWASSDPSVVTIGGGGPGPGGRSLATAVAAGTSVISATYQGITGSSTVTVTGATLVSISIAPASASIAVGSTQQFTATGIYSDNTSVTINAQATWISSDPSIAGITPGGGGGRGPGVGGGLASGIAAGTVTITATYQGVTGSATLTVTSATVVSLQVTPVQARVSRGVPVQFQAVAIFSDNTSENVTAQATWTSSDATVVGISDANTSKGAAQTIAPGTATISATWNGATGSTTLTVVSATLTTIQITPFAPTAHLGYRLQLAATGIYSDNSTTDLTRLATWTSGAPATASVSDAVATRGVVTPLVAGPVTISASFQGITGTDAVTVSSAALASIAVTPETDTIAAQAILPFTAIGTFADSTTFDLTDYVTWLSSLPGVAGVSNATGSKGQATGLSTGSTTVTAISGSISGTASLTVQ